MHTEWQALLNGNVTQLSAKRFGDAKTLPAIDVMVRSGYAAVLDGLKHGLDIRYDTVLADGLATLFLLQNDV